MSDLQDTIDEVAELLEENDIEPDRDDIEERMTTLHVDYDVPIHEARRNALGHYADEHDTEIEGFGGSSGGGGTQDVNLGELNTTDQWVAFTAKVTDVGTIDAESVHQTGDVADETGVVDFTSWADSDPPTLEEGQVYRFESAVTDRYQGNMQVQINSSTEITPVEEDIDAAEREFDEIYGAIVDVQSGSGLIKRCPEDGCTRVIQNGRCSEHGQQEGEFDLRIKAVLDNGREVQDVLFNAEETTELTGIDLEEAKEMAQKELSTEVVGEEITDQIVGWYYAISGPQVGRYVLARNFREVEPTGVDDLAERLKTEATA